MLNTDFYIPRVLKRDKMGNKDSKPVNDKHEKLEKLPTQLRLNKSSKDILSEIISVTNFNIKSLTLSASS